MRFRCTPILLAALAVAITLPRIAAAQNTSFTNAAPRITLDIMVVERTAGGMRTVVVNQVTPRGTGYRMGMVAGDTIVGINGKSVESIKKLHELLTDTEAAIVFRGEDGLYYRAFVGMLAGGTGSGAPESKEPESQDAKPTPVNPPPLAVNDFEKSSKQFAAADAIKWSQLPNLNLAPAPQSPAPGRR